MLFFERNLDLRLFDCKDSEYFEKSKWNRQKKEKSTLEVSKVDFLLY